MLIRSTLLILGLSIAVVCGARAQQSVGTIEGRIHNVYGEDAEALRVVVEEVTTEAMIEEAEVDSSGNFAVRNLPFATYDLYLRQQSRSAFIRRVVVRSAVPVHIDIDSLPSFEHAEVTVTDTHMEPTQPTVHTLYTAPVIQSLPVTNPAKAIEAVLLNSPGIVPDEDGRLHMRGEDAMLQYVVDGIPITTNQTRIYAPLMDASLIESADLLRGSLDPEYGVATSGVLNITTRSGFDAPNFAHGYASLGSFNNRSEGADFGGHLGQSFAYFVSYGDFSSDRYLDPVSGFDPNHTNGKGNDYFGKINIIASDKMDITALGYYGKTHYQVPNKFTSTPGQDQVQDLQSILFGLRANYSLTPASVLSLMGYTRRQTADLISNGLDRISNLSDSAQMANALLSERYFIGAHRKDIESGGQIEYSLQTKLLGDADEIKIGVGGEIFPLSEFFTFAVTDTNISSAYYPGGDSRLQPFDLRRGGAPFLVDTSATGKRFSAYAQDHLTYGDWTISGGLRYDMYDLLDQESGISPRLNVIYRASDRLVLRGSYNRMFIEAPFENALVSSSIQAGKLTGQAQDGIPQIVQSEKSHVFEVGAGYRLNRYINLDLSGYGKLIDDFIVKVELGNSGIIFPANIRQGFVAGGDLEVLLRDWNNFSGRVAFSTIVSKGKVPSDGTSPFAAGLVLGEEGQNYSHPFAGEDMFNTEHNQLLTASFTVRYDHPSGFFGVIGGRFDSGLPFDLVAPSVDSARQILLNRGYSPQVIDMLDLTSEMPGSPDRSVAPHATFDASLGYNLAPLGLPVRVTGSVINIFDTEYLYKFESTFGGTHFGTPRTFLLKAELIP